MAKIDGTYSVPNYENITYTHEYTDINDLLLKIEDNVNNTISAEDIRDSVYTLWKKITGLTPSGTSSETLYTNLNPTRITVGGIQVGSTFSDVNMKFMWDKLLYPYIAPSASLTGGVIREFYDVANTSAKISLQWSVIKGSEDITDITLPDGSVIQNPSTLSGYIIVNISSLTEPNIYTMSVTDGNMSVSSSTILTWLPAIYWGTISNYEMPTMDIIGGQTAPTWANGASVSISGKYGKILSNSKSGIYDGINGNGQYLVFAWPSSYGLVDPVFKINGLFNTAYQKIGSGVESWNMHGYHTYYDIWISSTPQFAPITEFRII